MEYYANILDSLGMDAELMLVWYDRDKEAVKYDSVVSKAGEIEDQISSLDLSEKSAKQKVALLKKEFSSLQKYIQTYKKIDAELESSGNTSRKICLAAGLTSYFGRESVCLYGGTVNLLRNTLRPTHFLNVSRILESSNRGCSTQSMGRVTGDPFDPHNPLSGLVSYKKSYGGDVCIYVGDMRLAIGTGLKMYLFTNLFPKIRHFRSTVLRNILNRKNSPSKGESR
jgi:lipid II:glycine glycyltransferase (peptidoglycan interpeptide bridge formation enzyme)